MTDQVTKSQERQISIYRSGSVSRMGLKTQTYRNISNFELLMQKICGKVKDGIKNTKINHIESLVT